MTHLDPVLLEAMRAAMPPLRLTHLERIEIKRVIESLISTLHPEGDEACDILAALTAAIQSRYDNKLRAMDRVEECYQKLRAAFENAFDSEEGTDAHDQYA